MLGTKEVRERIEVYLEKLENFTTTDLKRLLKDDGYIYNVDYDVYAFSNLVAFLKRNSLFNVLNSSVDSSTDLLFFLITR